MSRYMIFLTHVRLSELIGSYIVQVVKQKEFHSFSFNDIRTMRR